jgi:NAD-dependent deacetylase
MTVAGDGRRAAGQPAARRPAAEAARLAELLRGAERAVVLTGAGVSVPSGIPDFRSPRTGLWENVDPMEVAHIDARRGLIRAVITQNIDRLHRAAGTERLIEVHGSIEWSLCPDCGGRFALDQVAEQLRSGDGAPVCPACVAPLKPDVVLFGELLPEQALMDAQELAQTADLLVCVGSSLEVYPVAGLPAITRGAGGRIALVTQGPTPFDGEAEVKLSGDVVAELRAVLTAL